MRKALAGYNGKAQHNEGINQLDSRRVERADKNRVLNGPGSQTDQKAGERSGEYAERMARGVDKQRSTNKTTAGVTPERGRSKQQLAKHDELGYEKFYTDGLLENNEENKMARQRKLARDPGFVFVFWLRTNYV
ncbi:uncharacterized protein SPSK_04658 [Sporothrix schenckii 1099-18]|uniref:Uncharacterized protein n=1 Tax=Sporothrix schenckii 1099-18 TaxID=1397361 RepID=A0A0F2M1W4_SPOSC|nr:uncharacterized protein SPSK_04658 [Sporothrix schenckii 1099-18]KJR83079.1 hypothetical protein SPSK_04658 [Sporothrix schenckii 1099-18]